MILAGPNMIGVDTPHGEERDQGQGGSDQHLEEVGVAVHDDHAAIPGAGTRRQYPARGQGSGQCGHKQSQQRLVALLNAARRQDERQGRSHQNQFRPE